MAPAAVAAGQFLDAGVGRGPARRRGFPTESCSRSLAGTITTVRPRLCSRRRRPGRPRADHADRSTADHPVRGEAGTDEEEPGGTARPGLRRQPAGLLGSEASQDPANDVLGSAAHVPQRKGCTEMTGRARRQGRLHHRRRARPGPQPRGPAGRRRAPTSSRWTSATTSRTCPTRWPRRRTWPRRSSRWRRWTGGSSPPRPTCGTSTRSRRRSTRAWPSSGGWTSSRQRRDLQHRHGGGDGRQTWKDIIDINLTGVWHTARAAIPHLIAGGRRRVDRAHQLDGGLKAIPNTAHYCSAKHGVVGLMRSLALRARPALDPGQLRPPDQRGHPHVHERGDLPAVPPGPGEPHGRRRARRSRR